MKLFVALVCDLQPSTNVTKNPIVGAARVLISMTFSKTCAGLQIKQSSSTIVLTLLMITFLSSYLISN